MINEVNIPEFLNNPNKYITQTKEEYEEALAES